MPTDPQTGTADRAAAARAKIMASGNADLIARLDLLDAAAGPRPTAGHEVDSAPAAAPRAAAATGGPSALGLAAAAGGGAVLGVILGGVIMDGAMRAAFATVAEDAGFDPDAVATTLAAGDAAASHAEASDAGAGDPAAACGDADPAGTGGADGGDFDLADLVPDISDLFSL